MLISVQLQKLHQLGIFLKLFKRKLDLNKVMMRALIFLHGSSHTNMLTKNTK